MATQKELKIVVSVDDKATRKLEGVEKTVKGVSERLKSASVASAAFAGAFALGVKSVVKAANEFETSMLGLTAVADSFGIEADSVTKAANDLTEDGLLNVVDAASGLKNLLATGFGLEEAITLMNAFKDSAAFNRQGTLDFGEAIVGATIGIKNQNSILVDNAGITKNLSNILKEAGFSVSDLSNVTSDAAVRTALYNGLLKEAAIFEGDAALAADTYQGSVAALNKAVFDLRVAIGENLLPVIADMINEHLIPLIQKTGDVVDWFKKHEEAAILIGGAIVGTLVPALIAATTAFAGLAIAVAPFALGGAALAGVTLFLDMLSKESTGFTLLEQLTAAFELLGQEVDNVIDKINEFANKVGEKEHGFFADTQDIAEQIVLRGFAKGGNVRAGEPVVIGEEGPEVFVPKSSGSVIPNNQAFGGESNSLTVNFNGPVSASRNDLEAITRAVKAAIDRENALFAQGAL